MQSPILLDQAGVPRSGDPDKRGALVALPPGP